MISEYLILVKFRAPVRRMIFSTCHFGRWSRRAGAAFARNLCRALSPQWRTIVQVIFARFIRRYD